MTFTIYTDGGCSGNKRDAGCVGAYAYVVVNEFNIIVLSRTTKEENTTNNRMELSAVLHALTDFDKHYLQDNVLEKKDTDIVIISDSKYVVDNYNDYLQEWKKRGWSKLNGAPVLNVDLWTTIDKCTPEYKSVTFKWVKGHNGDSYNERVDMAVQQTLRKKS